MCPLGPENLSLTPLTCTHNSVNPLKPYRRRRNYMIQAMPPMYESSRTGNNCPFSRNTLFQSTRKCWYNVKAADALSFSLGCSLGCCRKKGSKCCLDHPHTATAQSLGSCQKAQALISDLTFILERYISHWTWTYSCKALYIYMVNVL